MLKVILDTSVFVAAFGSKTSSNPVKILESWVEGRFTLVMSPQMLEELVAKLAQRGVSQQTLVMLVAKIRAIALHIPGAYQATRLGNISICSRDLTPQPPSLRGKGEQEVSIPLLGKIEMLPSS